MLASNKLLTLGSKARFREQKHRNLRKCRSTKISHCSLLIVEFSYSSSDVVSNVLKHGFDASIIRRSRVARSLKDNGCTSEPSSDLPEVKPDTPEAFTFFKPFAALAKNASTPAGYDLSFSNMQKSISMSAYMGLQTLQTYDVSLCAKTCNATAACLGFNIFIKRNPSVSPAKPCPNPPSVPIVQCTLWGSPVLPGAATNGGEYLPPTDKNGDTFRSVITASNGTFATVTGSFTCLQLHVVRNPFSAKYIPTGYSKLGGPPTLKGFNGPVALHGAVNATKLIDPMTNKTSDIFIGTKFFRQPFDPAVCAALCNKTTETNKEAAQEQTEKGEGFNYMR